MAVLSEEKRKIAHLLRRAGFGVRSDEWPFYEKLGLNGTLEYLLQAENAPDTMSALQAQIGDDLLNFDEIDSVRGWWLYCMMRTKRPLEEKMTLFWHQHFATANYKVQNARLMWRQNETFRKYATGNFRSLLQNMVRDPAMLIWLDGAQNQAGKPNENFAREVMELFAIGIGNGYTEKDIQEAARSFTGWRLSEGRSLFDPFLHDDGPKTVFGQIGNFHGDDVIDLIAGHPATGKFLGEKLFHFFVHETPTAADIEPLAKVYYSSGYDMRAVLRVLLSSPIFYSDKAFYARIKTPVEFVVMAMRSLNAPLLVAQKLQENLSTMGQDLFNPPSVKGWDGGRSWINSRTLTARMGFTGELTGAMNRRGALQQIALGDLAASMNGDKPTPLVKSTPRPLPSLRPATPSTGTKAGAMDGAMSNAMGGATSGGSMNAMNGMMAPPAKNDGTESGEPSLTSEQLAAFSPEQIVDALWQALLPGSVMRPPTREALLAYAKDGKPSEVATRLAGLVNLIMAAPEYQLI